MLETSYIFYMNYPGTEQPLNTFCQNETDVLKSVIIGYPDNFHENPHIVEIVNQTQAAFYFSPDKPTAQKAKQEFNAFQEVMEDYGVTVYTPCPCDVPDQLTPRDIGFVIGDTFFVSNMAKESRKKEHEGIMPFIQKMSKVIWVPEDIVIEGGDIVVDKGTVFVGVSQRTTIEGASFLEEKIAGQGFTVLPVYLKKLEEDEDCLHLDCAFVPVGAKHALIYPDGFQNIPSSINDQYQWINVTREEQRQLATNVLSLSPELVISRDRSERINALLEQIGVQVIPLKFDEAPKTGGSFRCCTLTLNREPKI